MFGKSKGVGKKAKPMVNQTGNCLDQVPGTGRKINKYDLEGNIYSK